MPSVIKFSRQHLVARFYIGVEEDGGSILGRDDLGAPVQSFDELHRSRAEGGEPLAGDGHGRTVVHCAEPLPVHRSQRRDLDHRIGDPQPMLPVVRSDQIDEFVLLEGHGE